MIPFHDFHLPMPQYEPPVEPLIWIVNPSSLDIDEKSLDFFSKQGLIQFLNVLDADEQASEQLRVILRPIAIKIVTDEVDAEMEAAKDIFGMSSKDITPELLLSFDLDALLTARL
ncbi:hypothetical protein BDR04DRAFT_1098214 [Suillus decipiens]|nr:hypothetical protein BDR04DRAFT_1098214 [Suillus decipiens]